MINLVYIRLKNFVWLETCIGKDEIEIDRYNSPNNMIFISASNGGGKSSLMMELTPFTLEHTISRTAKRNNKDKIAEKELHFVLNTGIRYKCKIYYDKSKTSAYISKDNMIDKETEIELNPNGNISSYEEILERELGITKNYQQIGFLTPDLINFISMKATDRSRYLSHFLPDVSMFLKAHDIVLRKANEKKREIDSLNKELGKLSTINYENHLNQLKIDIDSLNKLLDKIKADKIKCQMFIDNFSIYQLAINQKEKIKQIFLEYSNKAETMKNKIKMMKESLEFYEKNGGENKLKSDLSRLENELIIMKEKEYSISKNIEKLFLSIREKELSIEESKNIEYKPLVEIIEYLEKYDGIYKKLENEIGNLKEKSSFMIKLFDNMSINEIYDFNRILEVILDLSSRFEKIENNNIFNLKYFNNKLYEIEKNYNKYLLSIETNEKEIKELNEKISIIKSNEEMKNLYKLREDCIKTCRIIQELEKYINIDNEKELMIQNKSLLEDKIVNDKKRIEQLDLNKSLINKNLEIINNINKLLIENQNNIAKFSDKIKEIFKLEEIEDMIKELNKIKIEFDSFKEYIHIQEKMKEISNSIDKLKIQKNYIISKNNLEKEINELNESKKELELIKNEKIINLEIEIENLKNISKNKEILESTIFDYNLLTKELIDVKSKLITLANIEYYNSHLFDIKKKLEIDQVIKEKELDQLEKERDLMKSDFTNKQQLEKLRDQYLELKNRYEMLKNIWSVKDGYPSILLESFLLELRNDVNKNLLEIWDNNLAIEEFVLTQSEFSIVMNRSGILIPDASQLSQGERAIMSLAISFSIIEMNLKEKIYDIIRLDELDATLDEVRSRRFFEMVRERIDRMGISSCFIISHRSEFESIPADLILLRGGKVSNLSNKNIIYQI